ncbi:MAG TPA: hypothetical protein DCZ23_08010 [Lachnospiraceae bacterium]|nr:hypothetical protein [Lachnospiraceae bacterium]
MVSNSVLMALIEVSALSFILPIALVILWKIRYKTSIIPSLAGALVFIVFGVLLKTIPNVLVTVAGGPVLRIIQENIWVYAIYAGLMAGIFEEMGRYIAFKVFLSKYEYRENVIAYGFGHGGIECITVLGMAMIQNFMYAQLINAGQVEKIYSSITDQNSINTLKEFIESILDITVADCVWAGIERISALILQVSLSVFVFQAVRVHEKKYMLAVAIALHTFVDIFAVLYQQGIASVAVTEIIIMVYAVIVAVFARRIYASLPGKKLKKDVNSKNWEYAKMRYSGYSNDSDGEENEEQ